LVDVVSLNNIGEVEYLSLVSGQTSQTLDDGEASTIGYAVQSKSAVAIDERKATGICGVRYPSIPIFNSLDLLLHPTVAQAMNDNEHAEAIFNALTGARMQVPSKHIANVIELIGNEKASLCSSLPKGAVIAPAP